MAALIWKDLGSYIFAPEHHSYGAEGDDGQNYVVGINTDPKSDLFSGYYVAIEPVGTVLGRNLKSAEEGKALAQKDYDGQRH
jgi:hypothetical protein